MSRRTLYGRVLRLRYVRPRPWQRAALSDGAFVVGVLLALADLASAWTPLVLPVAVAAVVKAHDVVAGELARRPRAAPSVTGELSRSPDAARPAGRAMTTAPAP